MKHSPLIFSADLEEEERCMDKPEKSTEEDRVTKELSNEIVIEPVSGPVTSDDDDEDVNDDPVAVH